MGRNAHEKHLTTEELSKLAGSDYTKLGIPERAAVLRVAYPDSIPGGQEYVVRRIERGAPGRDIRLRYEQQKARVEARLARKPGEATTKR